MIVQILSAAACGVALSIKKVRAWLRARFTDSKK